MRGCDARRRYLIVQDEYSKVKTGLPRETPSSSGLVYGRVSELDR